MLIRSNRIATDETGAALINSKVEGDKFVFTHAQNIDPILKEAGYYREHSDNGFSKSREFQKIATIPMLEYLRHPEFYDNDNAIIKWLKTDEGGMYRTTKGGI